MIVVQGVVAADTANVLAGTDLESSPEDGILTIWVISDAPDTLFSVSVGAETPYRNQAAAEKALAAVNQNDDPCVTVATLQGQRNVVSIDEVTAVTGIAYLIVFIPASEL